MRCTYNDLWNGFEFNNKDLEEDLTPKQICPMEGVCVFSMVWQTSSRLSFSVYLFVEEWTVILQESIAAKSNSMG